MSKAALLRFNEVTEKWEASYFNRVLASSPSKDYVVRVIERGFSQKAKNLGVTKCLEAGANVEQTVDGHEVLAPIKTVEQEFSINERFQILQDYVEMVANQQLASALITGSGGLGKSFTVMKTLRSAGLKDLATMEIGARFEGSKGYTLVKGYSTPKGLFRTLYENRSQIVVFDDCDSVLRDPTAINLLKAALDSYTTRIITWNAEGWGEDDLPKSFEFTGGVIFISNLPKAKIPQTLRDRAMCADVTMTRAECIERMRAIVQSDEFMVDFDMDIKLESLEFVAENANNPMVAELSLRSLVNVIKSRASKPDHWKRLGLYSMASS